MVYLKVSDGSETRKLQVTPGELSFDQLREQLATLFPKTVGEGSHALSLQYRDADGDVITLSSDQELQLALSDVEEDGVWKVYIKDTQRGGGSGSQRSEGTGQRSKRRSPCGSSLFRHFFEPSLKRRRLFSSVWDDLEEQLQLLHLLHDDVNGRSDQSTTSKDDNQNSASESEGSKSETARNTSSPSTSTEEQDMHAAEDPDEVVRSKPHPAAPGPDDEEKNADSKEPQWETRRFVTWEPRLQVGPFGFFHSHMTPVVYKVSFKSSLANGECCSSGEGEKRTESKEQASSATPEKTEKQAPTTAASAGEASTQSTESATATAQ